MKYLYFDAEAGLTDPKEVYEMLYDGLALSPRGFEGPLENRHISKVFDKLEMIGNPCKRNEKDVFALAPEKVIGPVILDDAEFTLAFDALKVIRWTGIFARKADNLYTWLEEAKDKPREVVILKES